MSELAHLGVDTVPTFLELKKSKANFYNDAAVSGTYPLVLRAEWALSTATTLTQAQQESLVSSDFKTLSPSQFPSSNIDLDQPQQYAWKVEKGCGLTGLAI